MPRTKLRVSIPEAAWIRDVSVEYPETEFRVVAVLSGEESGTVLLEVRTANPTAIVADVERRDDVTDFDLLWKRAETTLLQVETANALLLAPVQEAGIPLRTPFEVADGTAIWEVTASSERLSALGTRLERAGIDFDVEFVRADPSEPADRLLTDRQREVLFAAAEQGYYETPRRATLTEVSDSLGISKATGSDVLHRAEGSILTWFVEDRLTPDGGPV